MTRFLKYSAVALLALMTFVPAASARGFYGGRGFVGGGFGMGYYPGFYGGWYGPWYGPGYYVPDAGEVEIQTKHKGDQIFRRRRICGPHRRTEEVPVTAGKPHYRAAECQWANVLPGNDQCDRR